MKHLKPGGGRSEHPDLESKTLRAGYIGVHDLKYPRNSLIRAELGLRGWDVEVVPKARGNRAQMLVRNMNALFRTARRVDVLFVSEFNTKFTILAKVAALINQVPLVVDGFVMIYETKVGDWQRYKSTSLRARMYKMLDAVGVRLADLYLTDTRYRSELIERTPSASSTTVMSIPVAAPAWARWRPIKHAKSGNLKLLYYGNYIPLHGLEYIVDELALLRHQRPFSATFIGDGEARSSIVRRAQGHNLSGYIDFVEAVPEVELSSFIESSDVVLGIFGSSKKARSVIANKVWQGLLSGRAVVTRASAALEEIVPIFGEQIVAVEPESGRLASALGDLDVDSEYPDRRNEVNGYLREAFDELDSWMRGRRVML